MKKCSRCNQEKHLHEFNMKGKNKKSLRSRCKMCEYDECKRRRNIDPSKTKITRRAYRLKADYGLSLCVYEAMADEQDNVCYICKNPERYGKHLSVDHNHKTGTVRKLLCDKCNQALGLFEEDPERMSRAVSYILEHQEHE